MATDEEEALTALGAATIPQLPLSSEHYEFALTHNYAIEVRPPTAEAWHLVSVLTGFSRSTQSRTIRMVCREASRSRSSTPCWSRYGHAGRNRRRARRRARESVC